MTKETNLLRARAKAYAAPLVAFALVLSTGAIIVGHRHVDAATALITQHRAHQQREHRSAAGAGPGYRNCGFTGYPCGGQHRCHLARTRAAAEGRGTSRVRRETILSPSSSARVGQQFGHGMPGQGRANARLSMALAAV